MSRETAAAGASLWINTTTGNGAVLAAGLKVWLGTRRIELAGALVRCLTNLGV
ncbi:hypothetical protein QBC42DRAFT_292637 [Cladorrhinum samala]|uniref:Uncharacterized protein n=1 Tax=Cladorrhinum samala TaxID=585594 RepID=A0AAV9HA51_9PEZI|nr:hypothetical protein QBC42DRAFT_292637 [Cladorrhinum samala]